MPKLTLTFKGQALSVYHLSQNATVIGSDPACDVMIDSLAVAPRHARVFADADAEGCRIAPLDGAFPVTVNQSPVTGPTQLKHGDVIGVGKHVLLYAADQVSLEPPMDAAVDSRSDETAAQSAAYLQILSGEHIGRIIPLSRNMIRLGKSGGDCAMIVHRHDGHYLSPLEGRTPNLNGVPVGEEGVRLTEGSVVEIGETRLQFFR
jgi:predicted component of type VI protein secretion system